nr:hypothetical protein Ade03nite_63460 [Actinoplanes derwentensis]
MWLGQAGGDGGAAGLWGDGGGLAGECADAAAAFVGCAGGGEGGGELCDEGGEVDAGFEFGCFVGESGLVEVVDGGAAGDLGGDG